MKDLKLAAEQALSALKNSGADLAKCDVGCTVTHEFNVDGGSFSLFRTLFDKHLVMTAVKDHKKGSVRQNRYDSETIAQTAQNCLATADSSLPDEAWDMAPEVQNEDFVYGVTTPDLDKLFDRCRELLRDIAGRHPRIIVEQMIVSHKEIKAVTANSNGVLFSHHCGYYEVSLMFSAHEGEKTSSFFGSGFVTGDLERPFIECATVEQDLADVEKQIETSTVDGKFEGVVLLPPGCLASFVSYALSNFASDGCLLEGTSPWKDSLGETVADPALTVSLAPLDSRIVIGERVTDDGFRAENYDLIRDGKLCGFMASQYVSNKIGVDRAPNSSGNLIIRKGDRKLQDIIASIDRGIIVGRFSGGEPSSNGDFSGVAKNSFLIEKGKITGALSETMISGNLADMLKNIYAISDDEICDGMTVLPYMAFNGITVSGK